MRMEKEMLALMVLTVATSGCTSLNGSSAPGPEVSAENIEVSRGSQAEVEVEVRNTAVLGIADPSQVISEFYIEAAEPTASSVNGSFSGNGSSSRIGWIVSWDQPVNATLMLPVDSSKEAGVYRYSFVATNSGERSTLERKINITS